MPAFASNIASYHLLKLRLYFSSSVTGALRLYIPWCDSSFINMVYKYTLGQSIKHPLFFLKKIISLVCFSDLSYTHLIICSFLLLSDQSHVGLQVAAALIQTQMWGTYVQQFSALVHIKVHSEYESSPFSNIFTFLLGLCCSQLCI